MNNKIIAFFILIISLFVPVVHSAVEVPIGGSCDAYQVDANTHASNASAACAIAVSRSSTTWIYEGAYLDGRCMGKTDAQQSTDILTTVLCVKCDHTGLDPEHFDFNKHKCVKECNGGKVEVQGVCQCPTGTQWNPYANKCDSSCPAPMSVQANGDCSCGPGKHPVTDNYGNKMCLADPPQNCPDSQVRDAAGNCVPFVPDPNKDSGDSCPYGSYWDSVNQVCKGGSAPPRTPPPETPPGDNPPPGNPPPGNPPPGNPPPGNPPPSEPPNPVNPPRPDEPPKPDPSDNCPPGSVNLNGKCVKVDSCPPGSHSVAGQCVPNDSDPTGCPPGEVNINGTCLKAGTCPPGQHSVDGVCKPNDGDPTGCPPGEVNINGTCLKAGTCPPGQHSVDGVCKPNDGDPTGCPPGEVSINGTCVQTGECPPGQTLVNGKCSIKSEEPEPDPGPLTEWGTPPPVPEPKSWIVSNYKDGLPGVWKNFQSSIEQTSLIKGIYSIGSCVPSGGSCPDFTISMNFGMANFGSFNLAPPCWIWDILKSIIIITSLFTARRLIFGG